MHHPPSSSSLHLLLITQLPIRHHEQHLLQYQLQQTCFAIAKAQGMLEQGRHTLGHAITNRLDTPSSGARIKSTSTRRPSPRVI